MIPRRSRGDSNSQGMEQQEGVLQDVLLELDRERSRRAELEAKLRKMNALENTGGSVDVKVVQALEMEKQGYLQILEALTQRKPAIAAAMDEKQGKSLPLHVLRLLEIVPWDPRAQEYAFGVEHVYEWQIFDKKTREWSGEKLKFPKLFQDLPTVLPGSTSILEGVVQGAALHLSDYLSTQNCVLTNEPLTQRLNLQQGYPHPQDGGTWKWLGGWRIQKRDPVEPKSSSQTKRVIDCDSEGWSYGKEPIDFVLNPAELCWDNAGDEDEKDGNSKSKKMQNLARPLRRRKWTRKRILVDYPHCSEATREILRLLGENALLTMTSQKLSEQLVEIKTNLTDTEAKYIHSQDEMTRQVQLLRQDLEEKEQQLEQSQRTKSPSPTGQQHLRKLGLFLRKSDV